jgi:hypothetical protein
MGKRTKYYYQCHLERREGNQTTHLVTWLPERYAVLHKWLKLKDKNGIWTDRWCVVYIGARRTAEQVLARENDWKHQRQVSDA